MTRKTDRSGKREFRTEHDLLGEKPVPAEAYYGIQTARAMENFDITRVPIRQYPELIKALAMTKMAAARANHDCGLIPDGILGGIEGACKEIIAGKLHREFKVDVIQGGAGTSTNMNANEVIANCALEIMGYEQAAMYKYCHPQRRTSTCSQSTNDAYPSCPERLPLYIANTRNPQGVRSGVAGRFALRAKAEEFASVREDGTHPVAGCRADDARSGVRGLGRYPRKRGRWSASSR